MVQETSLKQFCHENAKHLNNIMYYIDCHIKSKHFIVHDKEKLFKTLMTYIYLHSYQFNE